MGFWDILKKKAEAEAEKARIEEAAASRIRFYNDVAKVLWFDVLYDDVLEHLHAKMEGQRENFLTYECGNNYIAFGAVKGLTSQELINAFIRKGQAELKDLFNRNFRITVTSDNVVVTFA